MPPDVAATEPPSHAHIDCLDENSTDGKPSSWAAPKPLEPELPLDVNVFYWGGYDSLTNLILNAAVYSGVTYAAGSLWLRASNRIRWGTFKPHFRRRRMVLALASGIFGTRLGIRLRTEEVSDFVEEIPFLSAPCLNLIYYPSIISREYDEEVNEKLEAYRKAYLATVKEEQTPQAQSSSKEGISDRILRMACHAWSTPETRGLFDSLLRYPLREFIQPPASERDVELAVVQLATAVEYEERSERFQPYCALFYASSLVQIFSTRPFLLRHSLWIAGLSLLPTLYSRIQDYILFFSHYHMDNQLYVAMAYELNFQSRLPLHKGMKPWEAPEDDPDAVVTVTFTSKQKPDPES